MNELTDLEICQRIAEIEGVKDTVNVAIKAISNQKYHSIFNPSNVTSPPTFDDVYNPLADDALCFKLMVKHNVSLTYGDYAVTAEILIEKEDGEHSFAAQAYCPKRAICVAIIESKE
jgi:hypothetical protein